MPRAPACGFGAGRVPEHSDRTDSTRPTDPETRHVDLECSHLQSSFYQRPGYGLFEKRCGASGSEQSASRGFTVPPGGPRGVPRAPGAPSLPGGQSPSEFLLSQRLLSATVCLQVVCSVTAFSIPACSIRSLTFFCRSSIRLPISSSSALRRAACRDPPTLTQKPSKTLLQMTAPDQVAWHQGSGSATCETRGSRRQSGLTCRQVPAEVLRCVFILGTVGSVLRTRLLRCARGLGNVR